jgi:ATP-dependent DNA ligase
VIDGEAVACGADGRSNFDFIRYRHHDAAVFLYAFDLLRLGVDDLRRDPLEVRRSYRVLTRHPIQRAHRGRRRGYLPARL